MIIRKNTSRFVLDECNCLRLLLDTNLVYFFGLAALLAENSIENPITPGLVHPLLASLVY